MAPITVFVCDDVAPLRRLIRAKLEEGGDLLVVGEAEDGLAGVAGIAELQPDVALLDISLPKLDGLAAIPRIKRAAPDTAIILFSGFSAERMAPAAAALGADLYLEKGTDLERVREAIFAVIAERR